MARRLRIQYAGALYHVVNRGNYRRDVFESEGAASAFLKTVEEAAGIFGWKLFAYAIMRNHFHLIIETVKPNLVDGMHWLQCTYSVRFNRFRSEQGHLFQGRYHAGLIEDFRVLGHIVDYVHLNPVESGIVPAQDAASYRWSSLGRFIRGSHSAAMVAMEWLEAKGINDDEAGWKAYQDRLCELAANLEEQKRLGWDGFSHGWAHGSESWRKALAEDHKLHALDPGLEAGQLNELKELHWNSCLEKALIKAKHRRTDLAEARKGEEWKIRIALELRQQHGIAIRWLAECLHLGKASSVRSLLSHAKHENQQYSS